ncbi:minor capsid protein [Glycomyces tenuis]|uniref:minor capsid protein n=1 Tax=Glycomyces tenuis TaxID=58116 RepID=UPI0004217F6D|nr:minor capsid protein [Glycomyces tenuis]
MALTRSTIALTRRLRRDIGTETDDADRHLTRQWVEAWDRLAPTWSRAVTELAAAAVAAGSWPTVHQIARSTAMDALVASRVELDKLSTETDTTASAGAERVVEIDTELEPRIIASQAPETQQEALTRYILRREQDEPDVTDGGMVPPPSATDVLGQVTIAGLIAGRFEPSALAAIIARAQGQIHADTFPLSPAAEQAMKDALIEGVIVGDHPEPIARDMLARVEQAFNGGLTRAMNIARTEMLDAYRASSAYTHRANSDLVKAWVWYASTDRLTCPGCFSRHGTVHPITEPGPDDHPRGRCTRLPKLATWEELGIRAKEPPPIVLDGEQSFRRLSRADQLDVMGPTRLALLDSGDITWDQLATWRDNPQWRRSNQPTTVRDLQRIADQEVSRVS